MMTILQTSLGIAARGGWFLGGYSFAWASWRLAQTTFGKCPLCRLGTSVAYWGYGQRGHYVDGKLVECGSLLPIEGESSGCRGRRIKWCGECPTLPSR